MSDIEEYIYQTPWGDWAFAVCGQISDGYNERDDAIVGAIDYLVNLILELENNR